MLKLQCAIKCYICVKNISEKWWAKCELWFKNKILKFVEVN